MNIVVDANIVFSAILNSSGKIGQLIITGATYFNFYTINLLRDEISEHKSKIIDLTKFSEKQFQFVYQTVCSRIKFVDEVVLPASEISNAMVLVSDIDKDDSMYIALNNYLSSDLWTGDKRLIKGLRKKGYTRLITTNELFEIFLIKQIESNI